MALIDSVKAACDRLAPLGWRDLILRATSNQLDISQPTPAALRTALTKVVTVNRTLPGFTDFATDGQRGLEFGSPARSLLYHAMASPSVQEGLAGFPALAEIEAVENLVFALQPPTLDQLRARAGLPGAQRFQIVVFAYEYRPAKDSCTGKQADLAFARTGIARVGTRAALYDNANRGFQSEVDDDPFAVRVCPSRFAAFLAVKVSGAGATVMRKQAGDGALDFFIPVHKLFDGPECISGLNLSVTYSAFHYNDKVRRTRTITLGMTNVPSTAPFQFTGGIAELGVAAEFVKGTVVPTIHARLVEPAMLNGQMVTYRVPPVVPPARRSFAALEPGADGAQDGSEIRPAPAYVHARTQVKDGVARDLNMDPTHPDINGVVAAGGYDALHYIDFTGEGQIDVNIPALAGDPAIEGTTIPAYSLVAAPDFFPSAGQRELLETTPPEFWGVAPAPLCDVRKPANLQMPNSRFAATDKTVTAIVSLFGPPPAGVATPRSGDAMRHSCLPDDCAGVFAPGWDVSTDVKRVGNRNVQHLAAYGLGSPFPEDAKLCAALSTFWPAAAPDASRAMSPNTGNPAFRGTAAPLTDEEIGQTGSMPWDGVSGPQVRVFDGAEFLDCESFLHVDYVRNALEGRFTSRLTARVSSDEYRQRMTALNLCYRSIGAVKQVRNSRIVVSFRKLSTGDPELQRAQLDTSTILRGDIYRVDLILATPERPHPTDFRRRLLPIQDRQFFLAGPQEGQLLRRRAAQNVWARVSL